MAKQDKVLEILALSQLYEKDKMSRLVRPWLDKPFSREQAKAIIKTYFDANGRTNELTNKLMAEKNRQEGIRKYRQGWRSVQEVWSRSPMERFKAEHVGERRAKIERQSRAMEIAQRTFGPYVRENFNEDTLALMSLISGEERSYEIKWLEAGFRPVRSVLIEVVTRCRVNPCQTNTITTRFLIYRTNGRTLVARTKATDLENAWGSQLPEDVVKAAPAIREAGFTLKSDLEGQQLLIVSPEGETKAIPWIGRTVDE